MIFKKAPFPAVMTVIAFLLFIPVYMAFTAFTVKPYLLGGLLFAIPAAVLGCVTFFAARSERTRWANILTAVLSPLLIIAAGIGFIYMTIYVSTNTVYDARYYQRALRFSSYGDSVDKTGLELLPTEPEKLGDTVYFSYTPPFLQGGEELVLALKLNDNKLLHCEEYFSAHACGVSTLDEKYYYRNMLREISLSPSDTLYTLYYAGANHGTAYYGIIGTESCIAVFIYDRW